MSQDTVHNFPTIESKVLVHGPLLQNELKALSLDPKMEAVFLNSSVEEEFHQHLKNYLGQIAIVLFESHSDNFRLAEKTWSYLQQQGIPLLFVGAKDPESFRRAYEVGAIDCLPSPVDLNILKAKISNSVGLFQARLRSFHFPEGKIRRWVDQVPALVSYVSRDLRYEYVNEAYQAWFGKPVAEIVGQKISDIFPSEVFEARRQAFEKVLKGEVVTFEGEFFTLHGRPLYGETHYIPDFDSKGEVQGFIVHVAEITEKVLARQQLEQSRIVIETERENFRNLFRQTPEMVCILSGPEHRFDFVNEAHVKALGFDATGMTVREAQPESVEVHGILDGVYQTGKTAELFEIPVTVGKSLRYFNLTYAAKRDLDGRVIGVMILGTEITEQVLARKALKESEERYRLLFDKSPFPKWIFDVQTNRFVDVNEAATQVYGYSRKEFLSMTVMEIRPENELLWVEEMLHHKYELGKTYFFQGHHHRKKDGTLMQVEVSTNELIVDGRLMRLVVVLDVTERARIEKKQQELMESLKAAKQEAEAANQLKSAFLANMSHEIRTPVSAMIGFADLLQDPHLPASERQDFIDIVVRNGQQLTHLIDDILDLSKVEAGFLNIEKAEVDPLQIVKDTLSVLLLKAKAKSLPIELTVEGDLPPQVVTDPLRLKQILTNIIGNAIKFTQSGKISVRMSSPNPEEVAFEISDTGVGIPAEDVGRLFQVFMQADASMTRKYGGTGLGLVLSKRLAQALGGDVVLLRSQKNAGSTFLITIRSLSLL